MKVVLRILKWLVLGVMGFLTVLFLVLVLDQDAKPTGITIEQQAAIVVRKEYSREVDEPRFDQLLREFGYKKKLAPGFELQCLLALSHFPELKDTPIDFIVGPSYWPLSSRPQILSTLLPPLERKYLVLISSDSADFWEPILLKNTPFNEQVGIIAHELGHTVYYQDKTALQLISIAYKYEYDREFYLEFERDGDELAIRRGLGYQMYDYAWFVRKAFGDSQEEIEHDKAGGPYLNPQEIALEMEKYNFYKEPLPSGDSFFCGLTTPFVLSGARFT